MMLWGFISSDNIVYKGGGVSCGLTAAFMCRQVKLTNSLVFYYLGVTATTYRYMFMHQYFYEIEERLKDLKLERRGLEYNPDGPDGQMKEYMLITQRQIMKPRFRVYLLLSIEMLMNGK